MAATTIDNPYGGHASHVYKYTQADGVTGKTNNVLRIFYSLIAALNDTPEGQLDPPSVVLPVVTQCNRYFWYLSTVPTFLAKRPQVQPALPLDPPRTYTSRYASIKRGIRRVRPVFRIVKRPWIGI
ncbi:hypothetical protein DPMN_133596 [Dreissena polymorpha]|uniref:Uncharacterized protein n=1 Tax=Dreissena polymorpha TaxID=45954 RepID=A0A9D4FUM4_DREPO|nr:hypothetical protein DPMN_133596 [Dreissena polymorpha]